MATSPVPQTTDFTRDVVGRYVCNGLDEALRSMDTSVRADARPFDVIVIGGGAFGPVFAHHLFYADKARNHRILVLEAGHLVLPEHVQNMPILGLNVPPPTPTDPGVVRNEVWGLPWRSDVGRGFPGLAYCLGGRSIYFGGWSPQLLDAEMPANLWPASVVSDLNGVGGATGYFRQASEQIGTTESNDFIYGVLQDALRQQLFDGLNSGAVPGAIPLSQLPSHLDNVPAGQEDLYKLEAPLAVQGRPPRSGFFPINKFSSIPLMMEAARAAQFETGNDDFKKRLMVVPGCHVTRLTTSSSGGATRVTGVETNLGTVPVSQTGVVVLGLGTIESARLALVSFPAVAGSSVPGSNLIAHLRSNLTIRIPRSSVASLPAAVNELQAAALFVKGRHTRSDGSLGHFHLQITAAGLDKPGTDSEAELFKKIPDIDTLAPFRTANDNNVVITIRAIGEMVPQNPSSNVTLATEADEFGVPRAFVRLAPSPADQELWDAIDAASDDVARVFANGAAYEALKAGAFTAVAPGQAASSVVPFAQRRDGLGTTHHEAGTLNMGDDPSTSITNADGRFHHVDNAYAVGPALFPTVGSPNPMLTGVALARRLADHLV